MLFWSEIAFSVIFPNTKEALIHQICEIYIFHFSYSRVKYFLLLVLMIEIFLNSRSSKVFFISRFVEWNIFEYSFWRVKYFSILVLTREYIF